ncbi:23S rRNA (uracil(1939)-C(5))-methyltransferase RlmD, partial [Flavobacteriaceae bacterium]|nr:23S rRNA (uracil(1939)-C(5))-methyltransferase RlmD [Flavobacteriaceae bacterium]
NISYDTQTKLKEDKIKHSITRIFNDAKINPIVKCDNQFFYRNKLEFSFTENKWLTEAEIKNSDNKIDRRGVGFHKAGMWDKIVDVEKCHLQIEPSNKIRLSIKQFAIENNLSFYNTRLRKGLLRTLTIRNTSLNQFMVLVQFYENDQKNINLVMNFLKNSFTVIHSLLYIVNDKENDSIYDRDIKLFNGKNYIEEKINSLTFRIYPKSFFQTNIHQTIKLYELILKYAEIKKNEIVYDLYSGLGTITQFVAKDSKKVVGVESVEEAVISAINSAKENKIDNVVFESGDMKNVFTNDFILKHGKPDVIITDPPREGMHKDVINEILKLNTQRIVYVSCNPSTQCRDLELLKEKYSINKVQPVDMFPHTDHVENIVLLELK